MKRKFRPELKKEILIASILGIVLGLMISSASAYANESAELTLTGLVEQDCSVSLDTTSYTVDLLNGENDSIVATVTEICNDANGYTISFYSLNNGTLRNNDDVNETKAYTVSYGSGISGFGYLSLSTSRSVSYDTYTAGNSVSLKFNLPAHNSGVLAAGIWSDTIVISISAR